MLTTSSLSCASQLSSSDWISNASKSFCSGVSFSIHFALSNFSAGNAALAAGATPAAVKVEAGVVVPSEAVDFCELSSPAAAGGDETVVEAVGTGLAELAGEEKKEVMEALALGFLAVEVATSAALRLSGVAMMDVKAGT